jgi:DNA helicase-2/ATP-dependent DNA helicase PcrA
VSIIAGAGTGKTRTITHRIAHLVSGGFVNPDHVLSVTFTNRAAAELRERLTMMGVATSAGEDLPRRRNAAS